MRVRVGGGGGGNRHERNFFVQKQHKNENEIKRTEKKGWAIISLLPNLL